MKFLNPSLCLVLLLFVGEISQAQTDIYVKGSGRLFPIAVPRLCANVAGTSAAQDIPNIVGKDLDLSGYFEVLNQNAYVEAAGKCGDDVAYSDWSVIGAEGLVKGVVTPSGDGVSVRMYLHDVQRQKVVLGKEYSGDLSQVPRMAHKFANEIMKFFTGEYGIFGTQIAFTSKIGRFKELFVMDMDGSNARQLTNERALAMSSAWNPNGSTLVYTSYRTRVPDLFEINVNSRAIRQVTRGPSLEVGSNYLPDGSIITSLTEGRESDLVVLNQQGRILRRITQANSAIDVSPDLAPDASKIVFCSNRSGGPQIYVMNMDGSSAKRISFVSSNYCTSPSWSPKGDKIAFVCRADAGFQMFVSDPDGANPVQLTSYGDNEDPDWSPDGRYLVFATTFGKGSVFNLALMRSDGTSTKQLTQSRSGDSEPTWSPVLP